MYRPALFFFFLLPSMLWANEVISGKVISVIDGNTFEILTAEKESYKIMFFGIDSPELTQEYGEKAKDFLEKMILEKTISVEIQGKDRWGTRLGTFEVDGEDPRIKLLEEGLAWTAERNPIEALDALKEKAKQDGKGLWQETEPVAPWTFRRQQTLQQFKTS
jgi:micrococcal nuclease